MPPSEVARQHSTQLLPMYKRPILRTFTSSKKVRSKFFQRIGILCSMNKAPSVSLAERSVRDLRNVPRFNEPLHYSYNHHEEEEQREPQQSEGKKGVNFQETVTVVPIPMRSEYSGRMRTKLWSDKVESNETVERNLVEFASEGYNWRNACHEDEMYTCSETRDLIHPVHVEVGYYTFGTGGS